VYYFKNNQPFELVNGGLGAEFEEASIFKSLKAENKAENKLTADILLREAVESFSNQNYAACVADFEILLKINKADVNALFYSGMSFYFLNKKEKAIEFFNDVLENKNNIFHQEAEFYKALALVEVDNNLEAAQLLKKIVEAKGFYAQRAKELLKTLK
jgi:tetratricopeptide (TPR) repeat protein